MSLFEEFQVTLGTILLGMIFALSWNIFDIFFERKKLMWIRYPLELILFIFFASSYFAFILKCVDGVSSIYYPLFLFCGFVFYYYFYSSYIAIYIKKVKKIIKRYIDIYLLKAKKRFDIIIVQITRGMKKVYGRRKKKEKKKE